MRVFSCICGAPLFFDNTLCTACGRRTGWCESCDGVTGLDPAPEAGADLYRCGTCGTDVALCANYAQHDVCNRTVPAAEAGAFCRVCGMNEVIPNLTVDGNLARWARLEAAKRRLVYGLDRLGLPYGTQTEPPLTFSFMGDGEMAGLWRRAGEAEQVYTGHADGLVTINIREADDAAREATRVDMGEAHRTLIGHFRHEVGHYYWDVLIKGRPDEEARFAEVFGDPNQPTYAEALERHYADGPPPDWQGSFVSSYATMHPWEDWAETFALWLAIASVLDTAAGFGAVRRPLPDDARAMADSYRNLGLVLNELSREMGLTDYAPFIISEAIEAKLAEVHRIMRGAAAEAPLFA